MYLRCYYSFWKKDIHYIAVSLTFGLSDLSQNMLRKQMESLLNLKQLTLRSFELFHTDQF